ncbi:MAG: ABC transporter substrate-binding protein [Candidatus Eremiobacteraeota bacterium]|nr:ABC transporter substrate-binding protein [Candidatus Eremiobacteraeota bacterium]
MKISLPALLCAVSLAFAPLAPAVAATPQACTKLVLTGHPTYPPVAWADGATLRGAGIRIVERLAKDAGIRIAVINEGSWEAAQGAVKSGKADAIVGIYRTQARLPFFNYVQPAIAPDPSAVVVRAGDPFVYKNWNSLVGKKGVVSKGESYGHAFDVFMRDHLTMQEVTGFGGVYQALLGKKADFGLVGYYAAIADAPATIHVAEKNFVTEGLYLAFGKSSPCGAQLSTAFSKDISRLIADGTVKQIFDASLTEYRATKR